MKKFIKACFVLILFAAVVCGMPEVAFAEEDKIVVEINEEIFPDDVFREHILTGSHYIWDDEGNQIEIVYDANKDGKLSESEIANIQQMLLQEMLIYDLTGIEYFTALIELDCQRTMISSLDVSKNTELQHLYCYRTNLTGTLDLSANTELMFVNCSHNAGLENVIVNNCTELFYLNIEATGVTSIDLSDNDNLNSFSCGASPIIVLDLSRNQCLTTLSCYNSPIESLDLSKNPLLENLDCSSTAIETLDLSRNTNLVYLDIHNTNIKGLDVSGNEKLVGLTAYSSSLVWLNIGEKEAMFISASEGTADLSVQASGFDITEYFPGIDVEKITVISGGRKIGNIIYGYSECTPVVYSYNCGTANGEEVAITVTLNLTVKGAAPSVTPDEGTEESADNDGEEDEANPNTGAAVLPIGIAGFAALVPFCKRKRNSNAKH